MTNRDGKFKREFKIEKSDEDRQIVFGWANVPVSKAGDLTVDSHDDIIDPSDLETACYAFNLTFRDMGENHEGGVVAKMVESFFVTPEKLQKMGLPGDALPSGWWCGFYIDDAAVFAKVKSGEYEMLSIQGYAERVAA
jgi:hypothetical protein